jgi:hypothetical protein
MACVRQAAAPAKLLECNSWFWSVFYVECTVKLILIPHMECRGGFHRKRAFSCAGDPELGLRFSRT